MMQIWETSCLEGNCAQPLSRRLLWVSEKSIKGAIVPEITRCPHMEGLCGILWSYSILFVYDLTLNNASLCYLCYFSCPWQLLFFFLNWWLNVSSQITWVQSIRTTCCIFIFAISRQADFSGQNVTQEILAVDLYLFCFFSRLQVKESLNLDLRCSTLHFLASASIPWASRVFTRNSACIIPIPHCPSFWHSKLFVFCNLAKHQHKQSFRYGQRCCWDHGKHVPVRQLHPRRGARHPRDLWECAGRRPWERRGLGGHGQGSASVRLPDWSSEAEGGPAADWNTPRPRAAGELEDRRCGRHPGKHCAHNQALQTAEAKRGNAKGSTKALQLILLWETNSSNMLRLILILYGPPGNTLEI